MSVQTSPTSHSSLKFLRLSKEILETPILVVGAGGIGCELLKNLVLTGFVNIHVIDLDTIDVSNLNRQFLFSKPHVGMSKAKVAAETVLKYNPNAKIVAHHANVKAAEFGPSYVEQFKVVLNALDNLSARRHVNRVCLAANVPLIDSGTEGYLGQVQVFSVPMEDGTKSECFECDPKQPPKTYPVCTVRSNPTKPIHCIVWSKMLFGRLFGEQTDDNAVTDFDENVAQGESKEGEEVVASTEEERKRIDADKIVLQREKQSNEDRYVFHKVFSTDILQLAVYSKKLYKGKKKPPVPLSYDAALQTKTMRVEEGVLEEQVIKSIDEYAKDFLQVMRKLKGRKEKEGDMTWDKDDEDHLDFVTAVSNIRSHIFHIPKSSKFTVKSKAGNIIPAIATTNAVIAGLIVIEAIKILNQRYDACRFTYYSKQPLAGRLLVPQRLTKESPECFVCQVSRVNIKVNTKEMTFSDFLETIILKELNMVAPTVIVGTEIIYESGEDAEDFEGQLPKLLNAEGIGITHNADVRVIDQDIQDFTIEINVIHGTFEEEGPQFEVMRTSANANNPGDEAMQIDAEPAQPGESRKRKRSFGNDADARDKKKARIPDPMVIE